MCSNFLTFVLIDLYITFFYVSSTRTYGVFRAIDIYSSCSKFLDSRRSCVVNSIKILLCHKMEANLFTFVVSVLVMVVAVLVAFLRSVVILVGVLSILVVMTVRAMVLLAAAQPVVVQVFVAVLLSVVVEVGMFLAIHFASEILYQDLQQLKEMVLETSFTKSISLTRTFLYTKTPPYS